MFSGVVYFVCIYNVKILWTNKKTPTTLLHMTHHILMILIWLEVFIEYCRSPKIVPQIPLKNQCLNKYQLRSSSKVFISHLHVPVRIKWNICRWTLDKNISHLHIPVLLCVYYLLLDVNFNNITSSSSRTDMHVLLTAGPYK